MRAGLARALAGLSLCVASLVLGACEEQHGFLKVGSNVLFASSDRLACGEATIVPQAGGLVDAFVTLAPQDCTLTLRKPGDFMGLGTKLCTVHIGNNRLTTVYLSESRNGVSCDVGGS